MTKNKEVRKVTLGLVLSWILGILFGLNAMVYLFTKQFIPTIAALAIFAVLLPPMNKLIKEKLNIELSRGIKIIVVIIGIFIIMFTGDIDKINQQLGISQQEIIPQPTPTQKQEIVVPRELQKEQEEKADEVVEELQEQAKSYKKIATFTGKGNKDTESFRIDSDKVKIVAKVESIIVRSASFFELQSESGSDLLNIKLSTKQLNVMPEAGEEGFGETIIRDLEKGDYYISVISGINWEVEVYEYS